MTDSSSCIRTVGLSVEEINEYCKSVLMLEHYKQEFFRVFDVVMRVHDYSECYEYERKFEDSLDGIVKNFPGFRAEDFNFDVELYCVPGGVGAQVIDVVTYEVARKMSRDLEKPVIVYLWCEDDPIVLFHCGKIIKSYLAEMRHHFSHSHWIPKDFDF